MVPRLLASKYVYILPRHINSLVFFVRHAWLEDAIPYVQGYKQPLRLCHWTKDVTCLSLVCRMLALTGLY